MESVVESHGSCESVGLSKVRIGYLKRQSCELHKLHVDPREAGSTQRRFQKIFEEGPPIIAPPEVFREMELAAMRLTQSIGYHGAGTVEYDVRHFLRL